MVEHWIAQVKKVQRKIEVLAWCDGSLIERRGTNHEWSRPIGKPAGPCARGCGLEDTRIVFGVRDGTKDAPERAPQDISGESGGKVDGIARGEMEPARFKIECHFSISRTLVASSSVENGFCKK
jgi:hypothetical protein